MVVFLSISPVEKNGTLLREASMSILSSDHQGKQLSFEQNQTLELSLCSFPLNQTCAKVEQWLGTAIRGAPVLELRFMEWTIMDVQMNRKK